MTSGITMYNEADLSEALANIVALNGETEEISGQFTSTLVALAEDGFGGQMTEGVNEYVAKVATLKAEKAEVFASILKNIEEAHMAAQDSDAKAGASMM